MEEVVAMNSQASLSSPAPSHARTIESVAPAAATPPPKHFTDVDLTVDGPGVQFVGVPAIVNRPIHPLNVVEVDLPQFRPLWTFV
jgi:hypothetical protein